MPTRRPSPADAEIARLQTAHDAAETAYQTAHSATEAARTAAYALDWGSPGEDEAWQALERCQVVETARHTEWLAAIDARREGVQHTPIISENRAVATVCQEAR